MPRGRRRRGRGGGRPRLRSTKRMKLKGESAEQARQREQEIQSVPRCLIFPRSKRSVGRLLEALMQDMRTVMLPFTPKNVSVQRRTPVRRLLDIARSIYVSHFLIFSLTERAPSLKVARVPFGPTIYFTIEDYSLMRDVQSFYSKVGLRYDNQPRLTRTPCVPLFSNFNPQVGWQDLTRTTLEHIFPSPVPGKTAIPHDVQRVVMFNFRPQDGLIDFRHYSVQLTQEQQQEEENGEEDVNEINSDSETQDPSRVVRRVGLSELGPRLTLRVEKIVSGILDGEVLYHVRETRTNEEEEVMRERHDSRRRLRDERRRVQEENVERKREKKRAKKLKRKKRKRRREGDEERDVDEPATKRRRTQ